MTGLEVGVLGFVALLVLLTLRVPVAISMFAVGLAGMAYLTSSDAALARLGQDSFREASNYTLSVIPMFILMGLLLSNCGLGSDVYSAVTRLLWRFRGGLGVVTIGAGGIFGSVNGSVVASSTTLSAVAVPEMIKRGYDRGYAAAVTVVGGTIGALIPPSAMLVLFGILTETSINDLFIAAIIPGVICMVVLMAVAYGHVLVNNDLAPDRAPERPPERKRDVLLKAWAAPAIFTLTIGGLYLGYFTASESGAVGAGLALTYGLVTRRLNWTKLRDALVGTVRTTSMVFLLVVSGKFFGYFLATSRVTSELADWVLGLGLPAFGVLLVIVAIYFVLGALMDEAAILVIMTPVTLPIILALGYDVVWFGVLTTMMLLTGLITPPVGLITFVVSGASKVPLEDVFRRIWPYSLGLLIPILIVMIFPGATSILL